jgi:hypothetical protein
MVHRINPKMKIMNSTTRMEMHKNDKERNEIQSLMSISLISIWNKHNAKLQMKGYILGKIY